GQPEPGRTRTRREGVAADAPRRPAQAPDQTAGHLGADRRTGAAVAKSAQGAQAAQGREAAAGPEGL
ncbi:MAG: hypothetical protein AVDCRST_MAG73-2138, partial [uncultured Thermomicrobiales bacterium]